MENYEDSDNDMSWLTQTSNGDSSDLANFNVGNQYIEEDILSDKDNIVSLEDNGPVLSGKVLYDNVVVEDISSDEGIDTM